MNWMSDVILPFLIVHRSQNSVTADLPVGLNVTFSADGSAVAVDAQREHFLIGEGELRERFKLLAQGGAAARRSGYGEMLGRACERSMALGAHNATIAS